MPSRLFRTGLLVFCVCACAAAYAGGLFPTRVEAADPPAPVDSHPVTVLVFPFENESRVANLDWLGEGLSELTSERLLDRGVNVLTRQDRLAALEKMGLPDTTRLSHAMIVKIASEADADVAVFGRFISDGKTVTLEAHILQISPPSLSPVLTQSGDLQGLMRVHSRLSWQILCLLDGKNCPPEGANRDESSFSEPPPSLRMDAMENFIRGFVGMDDDVRLRLLREASRLEPSWDRPPFELGQMYFERRDCETALPWFSRVPPARPDGPEASFNAGVCHLIRNDAARADATFSVLIDRSRSSEIKERLPEFPEVRNNLGVAQLRQGKWNEAEIEFERAAVLDSDEPDYWVNLGIAKLAGKQAAGAIAPLERARNIDPDDKDARALLIATLESVGRGADAATIRAEAGRPEASEGAAHAATLNVQDPDVLVKMARISDKFDRALLRTTNEDPATRPATHVPRGNEGKHGENNRGPK